MARPPATALPRKRTRKRRRRAASSSSSDGSSSSDSDDHALKLAPPNLPAMAPSSSSDDSSSDSDSSLGDISPINPETLPAVIQNPRVVSAQRQSLSPVPVPTALPPFLPHHDASEQHRQAEQALKARFRKFWMSSVADAFKDDLEDIRKEPNLTTSRLALLIDSLASGAEVFTSSRGEDGAQVNEMEVILDHAPGF